MNVELEIVSVGGLANCMEKVRDKRIGEAPIVPYLIKRRMKFFAYSPNMMV